MNGMKEQLARALLGSGMAGQSADKMQAMPAYRQYAEEMMSQGQQPMPFEQWMMQMQQMQGGQNIGTPQGQQMPEGY